MSKYKNVMALQFIGPVVYDTVTNADLLSYKEYIGANTVTDEGWVLARSKFPRVNQAGSWLYHLIKIGHVKYIDGVDYFDHYIKMPLTWLDGVYKTKEIPVVEDNTTVTEYIYNKDHFKITSKNDTHCLVKIEHKKWTECYALILFDDIEGVAVDYPINVYCSDKYDEELALNFPQIVVEEVEEEVV